MLFTACTVRRLGRLAVVLLLLILVVPTIGGVPARDIQAAAAITGLHVQGDQIVNDAGQSMRLLGVDRSGSEYACIQGWGLFDGPSDAASVQAMAAWHTDAVRVPLNEDCWLGINGAPAAYSGAAYQQAIATYVSLLNQYGLVAILDLHWNAPGSAQATSQQPMPDQDHAPAFWTSVATAFKSNSSVIFDLYNEPYPDSNQDTTAAWTCWKNGGTCPGVSFPAAGMQELVTAVRTTGATNIIMLGGVQYSGSLSQWLAYKPSDPQNNLAASWHSYNFGGCNSPSCWDGTVAPVAQQVPLIVGEIGENDCAHGYIDSLMPWLDSHGASYLGWTWDTWNCASGPALISNYNGTPTTYGVGYQTHLAALAQASPTATATAASATSTPTPTPVQPTSTPVPSATATPAALAFTFNRVSRSAAWVARGGTEWFTATITANRAVSNELVGFMVYNSSGAKVWQTDKSRVSFTANMAQTVTARWAIPSTLPIGAYTLKMGVFTSTWTLQKWNNSAATVFVV